MATLAETFRNVSPGTAGEVGLLERRGWKWGVTTTTAALFTLMIVGLSGCKVQESPTIEKRLEKANEMLCEVASGAQLQQQIALTDAALPGTSKKVKSVRESDKDRQEKRKEIVALIHLLIENPFLADFYTHS